jgi:hypothetical protein
MILPDIMTRIGFLRIYWPFGGGFDPKKRLYLQGKLGFLI